MRLQSHRHKTLSIILCVCVCVWGWKEAMSRGGHGQFMGLVLVRFQCTNCCCCCCPYGLVFGNLCSVCIVCAPVRPPLPLSVSPCCERQAFSCLNLSCIMSPIKQSKRNQNIEHREGPAPLSFPFNFFSFLFFQISHCIFQLFPLAKSSTWLLLLNFRFYILVRLSFFKCSPSLPLSSLHLSSSHTLYPLLSLS